MTRENAKIKDYSYKNTPYFSLTFSHYFFYSNVRAFPSTLGGTWPVVLLKNWLSSHRLMSMIHKDLMHITEHESLKSVYTLN